MSSSLIRLVAVAAFLVVVSKQAQALQRRGQAAGGAPKVPMVQSLGCVERKGGSTGTWWITRATDAKPTQTTFFNATDVDEAKATALGTSAYQLIGVADFLDVDGLLQEGQRSQFTTRQSANASGQLRAGRKVVLKGLLIEGEGQKRINLTQVVSLADACQ